MSKRSRYGAIDMPYILEGLIREAEYHVTQYVESEDPWWPHIARTLEEAEMWWVTKPMAHLAYSYAPEMPEWDLAAVRPSLTGIMLFEGSTGSEWQVRYANKTLRGVIVGAWWGVWNDKPHFMPLVKAEDAPWLEQSGKLVAFGPQMGNIEELPDFAKFLAATMILAQTETVASKRIFAPGYGIKTRQNLPTHITQIVLRERVRDAHLFEASTPEEGDHKWTLKNRHLVRGHWRKQAFGPNQTLRKPVFVPPYIKGPEEGELIIKPQVKVWRR